jgi:2-keto-4-pentenoate hydratase/2-oxohepta-3-ene-1,7-dioic acid hydratase in catechol pathway
MKTIRYTLNPSLSPYAPDASPDVHHATWSGDLPPGARLLPPCSPSKIMCVGRNYAEHVRELGNEIPGEPLIFLKPPSSLLGSGDTIVHPPISRRIDHEGELGVVIGRRGRNIPTGEAWDYVRGFTCVNDVTARDLQKKDGQWTRGKGFDTFCPVGPCLVTPDEVEFSRLRVQTYVDGQKKQDGAVQEMLFGVDVIISYLSEFMTLELGDLIATGTPPGVGTLLPGSTVQIRIDGIGVLENSVKQG